jgi:hypothetical protein
MTSIATAFAQAVRVECEIEYTELENDDGVPVESVVVTCSRCGHATESFGTTSSSVRRCLVLLREECPKGQSNFYLCGGDGRQEQA